MSVILLLTRFVLAAVFAVADLAKLRHQPGSRQAKNVVDGSPVEHVLFVREEKPA